MWIKLTKPLALFCPWEILPRGEVVSVGNPRGEKLVLTGQAVKVAFPSSPDPDDVNRLRDRYKKANGDVPLWDEPGASNPRTPAPSGFGARITQAISARLGARLAAANAPGKIEPYPSGRANSGSEFGRAIREACEQVNVAALSTVKQHTERQRKESSRYRPLRRRKRTASD